MTPRLAEQSEGKSERSQFDDTSDPICLLGLRQIFAPPYDHYVTGTGMAKADAQIDLRDFGPPVEAPRACFERLAARPDKIAFVFGSERFGLSNEDVYRCHVCLSIPTNPDYGSLNLAQAVQLLAYEWRQALGGFPVVPRTRDAARAGIDAVQGALGHWEQALVHLGFLDPKVPRKLMPRLNQLLNRAEPTLEEISILRGIAREILRRG